MGLGADKQRLYNIWSNMDEKMNVNPCLFRDYDHVSLLSAFMIFVGRCGHVAFAQDAAHEENERERRKSCTYPVQLRYCNRMEGQAAYRRSGGDPQIEHRVIEGQDHIGVLRSQAEHAMLLRDEGDRADQGPDKKK